MRKNNKKGFTLVELVIVIAVIAILAAILIPTFTGVTKDAEEAALASEAKAIYTEYLANNAKDFAENFIIEATVRETTKYYAVVNGALGETAYDVIVDTNTETDGAISAYPDGSTAAQDKLDGYDIYVVTIPTPNP